MMHSGFEATAVQDAVKHPLKALKVALAGVETQAPMRPDIPLENARAAEYVFSRHVEAKLEDIARNEAKARLRKAS